MTLPAAQVVFIAVTAVAAAGLALTGEPAPQRFIAAEHPAAVLAWAKLRCDAGLELHMSAPRAQREDVMQVAAAFETSAAHRALETVCADALGIAAAVTARSSAPASRTRTGSRELAAR